MPDAISLAEISVEERSAARNIPASWVCHSGECNKCEVLVLVWKRREGDRMWGRERTAMFC